MNDAPSNPRYRFATAADIPALVRMINAAFVVESFLHGTRTDASQLGTALQQGRILLAEDGAGEIVASVYLEAREKAVYLGMLAVEPTQQGTGLARDLLHAMEKRLTEEGVARLELTVLSRRMELLPIYRRLGFQETGTIPFHSPHLVKDGLECYCICMAKPLVP